MIIVSRRYAFSASHRLHVEELSEQENQEIFGKCNNPFGHGHNYELEVSAKATIHPETGRAVDLQKLDDLVHRAVLGRYDHRYLNDELPEFRLLVPTTENLGLEIQSHLQGAWNEVFPNGSAQLAGIRIFETERNIIQVGGI